MSFNVRKRGVLSYYFKGDKPSLSYVVTEDMGGGNLKIYFAGLAGGSSAQRMLGLENPAVMNPKREVELIFRVWENWLREAGICERLSEVDFLEIRAFGCQPKAPNPLVDPVGYADEMKRLRGEYTEAYRDFFAEHLPDNGVPARFTVHVVDVPDEVASYEFSGVAMYQKSACS